MKYEKADFLGKYNKLIAQCRKELVNLLKKNEGCISLKMSTGDYTGDNTTCHIYNKDGGTDKGFVGTVELIGGDIILKGIRSSTRKPFAPIGLERICEDDIFWIYEAAFDSADWKKNVGKGGEE